MKKHLIYLCVASVLGLTGCTDVNDEFEGLDKITVPENVINKDYTLTAEDYATISALKIDGVDANALKAVKTNLYLTDATPAKTVLPVFMNSKWNTASTGSAIKMTYDFGGETPAYLAAIVSAKTYTLSTEDYKTVWGLNGVEYLTPEQAPEQALPKVLNKQIIEAEEGEVMIAEYVYSEEEPELALPTFIDEDFESVTVDENVTLSGWTNFIEKGTKTWIGREFSGNKYIQMSANKSEEDENIAWLVSPKVNLAESSAPTLSFDITIGYYNASCLQILVSEDYVDDVTTATWTDITANFAIPQEPTNKYGKSVIAGLMDMSAYKKNINIAFKYTGSGTGKKTTTYQIDNLYLGDDNAVKASNIFTEDFETCELAADNKSKVLALTGWLNTKADQQWMATQYSNNIYAQVSAFKANAGDTTWLITPSIALAAGTVPVLKFDLNGAYYNADCLEVYVSTDFDGTNVEDATWIDVTSYVTLPQDESYQGFKNYSIPLVSYVGKSVYIGFKYTGDKAKDRTTTYQIDNVNVVNYSRMAAATSFMAKVNGVGVPAKKAMVVEFNEGKWTVNTKVLVLSNEDYKAMGEPGSHNNFSSSIPAGNYLPKFLANKYPYASEGDVKAVVYNYYDSEAKTTVLKADEYVYAGDWKYNNIPVETVTEQYAYSGSWMYDPNVTITLLAGKGNGDGHFQALTDWVWENIDVPAGVKEKGKGYVTKYGNNDYYFGGSEYQNNFDFRPDKWKEQMNSVYGDMANDKLTELMWERLLEAVKIMLTVTHPEARPVDGLDVIYTVNFVVYDNSNANYTIQYQVTAPGEFTYVDGSLKKVE
ncbi:MAG: DUF5017 domain-containing protein [Oscillibacter sp.]|nr:DUF5017 domain-containing protein [Oscillibacter sp.]